MCKAKKDVLLLVGRLVIGGIFVYAGWMKISAMAMTIGFFSKMGIPAFLAYLVGYGEFLGGIALVLGFLSETAAGLLAIIMLGAIYFTRSNGFMGFGMPLVTLVALLQIVGSGAGKYAVRIPCKKSGEITK